MTRGRACRILRLAPPQVVARTRWKEFPCPPRRPRMPATSCSNRTCNGCARFSARTATRTDRSRSRPSRSRWRSPRRSARRHGRCSATRPSPGPTPAPGSRSAPDCTWPSPRRSRARRACDPRVVPGQLGAMRAVAAAYTEALREAIAAMVTGGRTEDAKRLSSFRNKLLGTLTSLRAAGAGGVAPVTEAELDGPPSDPPPGGRPRCHREHRHIDSARPGPDPVPPARGRLPSGPRVRGPSAHGLVRPQSVVVERLGAPGRVAIVVRRQGTRQRLASPDPGVRRGAARLAAGAGRARASGPEPGRQGRGPIDSCRPS